MRLITTVVRPERLPEVKAALFRAGVTGITLSRVTGHGGEREVIEQTLFQNNYSRTHTARALGISRVTLYNKMKKYGMTK